VVQAVLFVHVIHGVKNRLKAQNKTAEMGRSKLLEQNPNEHEENYSLCAVLTEIETKNL
jgi:hypothetical protein